MAPKILTPWCYTLCMILSPWVWIEPGNIMGYHSCNELLISWLGINQMEISLGGFDLVKRAFKRGWSFREMMLLAWKKANHHVVNTGTTWQGTSGDLQEVREVSGQQLATKGVCQSYCYKEMKYAHKRWAQKRTQRLRWESQPPPTPDPSLVRPWAEDPGKPFLDCWSMELWDNKFMSF